MTNEPRTDTTATGGPTLPGTRGPGQPRPRARRLLALALVTVAAAATLTACSSSGNASSQSTASGTSHKAAGQKADAITISDFAFSPNTITVAPGATVTVTNKDQVAHTVTSSKGGFNTGDILPGSSTTFTAPNTPGRYPYICSIHQFMTGTLTVS
jgi:plastocyanin